MKICDEMPGNCFGNNDCYLCSQNTHCHNVGHIHELLCKNCYTREGIEKAYEKHRCQCPDCKRSRNEED